MLIFHWIVLWMKNISDESCSENQNPHFVFGAFFSRKSYRLWDNVVNYDRNGEATSDGITRRMRFACVLTEATDTSIMCKKFPFHDKNFYENAPQSHVICTLSVLLSAKVVKSPHRRISVHTAHCIKRLVRLASKCCGFKYYTYFVHEVVKIGCFNRCEDWWL